MSKNDYPTEWDGTRFPREKNTAAVMGLDWAQVIFLVVAGLGVTVVLFFSFRFPVGAFLGIFNLMVAGAIGIPRVWGRSLVMWAVKTVAFLFRGAQGQLRYEREMPVATIGGDRQQWQEDPDSVPGRDKHGRVIPGPGHRLALPGEHAELVTYDLPGGAGFVFDPKRKEGMIVAKLITERALALESDEKRESRTIGFRDTITSLAGVPGVSRVQLSNQTTMISGSKVLSWYKHKKATAPRVPTGVGAETVPLSGENVNPFADVSYEEFTEQAKDQPVEGMWLTVVLDAHKLERRALAAGGGLRGFMEVALGVMGNIEHIVPISGTRVIGWHTSRSAAAIARSAFDPSTAVEISDREDDWAGAAPESAGPTGAQEFPSYLYSDGWYHRTYEINEWPQQQARIGFLEDLVFAGSFRHTVTVYLKPKDLKAAMRKTQNRKGDWESANSLRQKLDRPDSLEHKREYADIEQEETDLMEGHAAVDIVGLVTVSAQDEERLEAHCADINSKAVQARLELRPKIMQQAEGFVACALPYGRALLR